VLVNWRVRNPTQLFREQEEVMRRDCHTLDRAFDEMLAGARADMVAHRTVEMVIGIERARPGKTTGGLFP
jgi:hypothetical protein